MKKYILAIIIGACLVSTAVVAKGKVVVGTAPTHLVVNGVKTAKVVGTHKAYSDGKGAVKLPAGSYVKKATKK